MKTLLKFSLLLLLFGCSKEYEPLTLDGYWNGYMTIMDVTREIAFNIHQDQTSLSGDFICGLNEGLFFNFKGSVEKDSMFIFIMDNEGYLKFAFAGQIRPDFNMVKGDCPSYYGKTEFAIYKK